MRIYYDRGIIIEDTDGGKLYLDPELSSNPIKYPTFVTHAHSDHTAGLSGAALTYLTETTLDLYNVTSKRNAKNYHLVEMNEPFEIGNFEIEYLNAGHLLGAAQILVRKGSKTALYTGDFCPEDLLTIKGAEIPREEVDLAIVDSTYGDHLINFNSRSVSRQRLFVWLMQQIKAERTPVINVGHLGGAQEVIKYLNQLAPNLPIIVSNKIKRVNQVFEKYGVKLKYYTFDFDDITSLLRDKSVILVPRSFKNMEELSNKYPELGETVVKRCIITGQSAKYGFSSYDYTSALSTHAHFDELVEVIKELNPSHTLTHYGYHQKFAQSLIHDHRFSAGSFESSDPVDIHKLKPLRVPKRVKNEFYQPSLDDFM